MFQFRIAHYEPMRCRRSVWLLATAGMVWAVPCAAKPTAPGPLLTALGAPAGLEISGSVRSRVEAIDGQFRPARATSDFLWSMRTTLFAAYKRGPIRIGGEIIDARGYGEKNTSSTSSTEVDAVELAQAFVAVGMDGRFGLGSKAALTGGRFTLDIGSSRLVGRTDFPNTVNSYTGLNFDWHGAGKDRLVAFWSMPQTRLPTETVAIHDNAIRWDRESTDQQFFGASYVKGRLRHDVSGELYGYRLAERDSPNLSTRNRRLITVGGRLLRIPGGQFDVDVEGAYQFGKARATIAATDRSDLSVSAYFVHAEFGRTFVIGWSPRVSLHFDRASGDRGAPGEYGRFDALFGARRADFGPVDLYGPIGRSNLVSPGIRLEAKPSRRLDSFVMLRELWLDSANDSFSSTGVRDRSGQSGRHAGVQIEGRVRYWVVPKRLRMDTGVALLAKGRFLHQASNAPSTGSTHYAYFDLATEF